MPLDTPDYTMFDAGLTEIRDELARLRTRLAIPDTNDSWLLAVAHDTTFEAVPISHWQVGFEDHAVFE